MNQAVMGRGLALVVLGACGGGGHGGPAKTPAKTVSAPTAPRETEADREAERAALARAIVPKDSTCLPLALKGEHAPRLDFAALGGGVRVCAFDVDRTRLLGPVGCWKVALDTGALTYEEPAPLPGADVDVLLDGRCARGFCIPEAGKLAGAKVAHMTWNLDGTKVAVLVGDHIHIFDTASRAHQSSFSIRGDQGVSDEPSAVHFVGDRIFVEAAGDGSSGVWQFKSDGTAAGPLLGADAKPLSTLHGSFLLLDADHVGVAERGMDTLTTLEISTGKRTKLARKVGKLSCKAEEVDAFWHDGDHVGEKCRDSMTKNYSALIGATAVTGRTGLLVMLRNDRLGEFSLLDPKLLTEKKAIKLPWCEPGPATTPAPSPKPAADDKGAKPTAGKGTKPAAGKGTKSGDDDDDDDDDN